MGRNSPSWPASKKEYFCHGLLFFFNNFSFSLVLTDTRCSSSSLRRRRLFFFTRARKLFWSRWIVFSPPGYYARCSITVTSSTTVWKRSRPVGHVVVSVSPPLSWFQRYILLQSPGFLMIRYKQKRKHNFNR